MKTNKKEVIDTKAVEMKEDQAPKDFGMDAVCSKCGHHGFCKYEGNTKEALSFISDELKNCNLDHIDPFVLVIQCKGFCQVAENNPEK